MISTLYPASAVPPVPNAKNYPADRIRCNAISPAGVHTPFVDDFLAKNYPGNEAEMMQKLAAAQPIGRMGTPGEISWLALYLCSSAASFVTVGYPSTAASSISANLTRQPRPRIIAG